MTVTPNTAGEGVVTETNWRLNFAYFGVKSIFSFFIGFFFIVKFSLEVIIMNFTTWTHVRLGVCKQIMGAE